MKSSLRFKLLVALTVLAIGGLAVAQDPSGDPPTRVMRLQQMDGAVSLQPGGVDDWVAANLNRPLTTADRIWTDVDSRAELTMASAALRMGSETSVTLTNLDDNTTQIELDQGTLNLSVRFLNPDEIMEVDTPNFAYTVSRPGEYRFEVLPNQDTSWITVRRGDGEATGQDGALRIHSGQQYSFSQGQSLNYMRTASRPPDAFDEWCEMRERRETASASAQYVAAGTVGYEDLDDNGTWVPSAAYGTIWYPRVHEGWAPYREGHWAWVEPWGWTWVDDAPWGFAPFHYGRWVNDGGRWGWIPGPVGVRPVYAPALVAWVGGPSLGVSIGIGGGGGVGWFPLGWHDPYIPSYHVSPAYARNVNISNSRVVNVTVINNYYSTTNVNIRNNAINNVHYENAGVHGAVTGVSNSTFASGKPVRGNFVVVPASVVGRTSVMTNASVVPTKAAVLGGHAPSNVPQHVVAPRQVASKVAPPQRPLTFEQQRPLLEKSNGVPLAPTVRANIRATNPPPSRNGQPAANQQGGRPPVANQPAVNQQKPPVANQPGAFTQGGRPPVKNVPVAPQQTAPPANANQPPAGQNGAPVRNVPRPSQPTENASGQAPATHPAETPSRPIASPTPAREAAPTQPQRNVAPAQPQHNAAPARETAPVQAPHNTTLTPAQPPRSAAPAQPQHTSTAPAAAPTQEHKTPPPAKENKNENKSKEKETK